MKNKLYLTFDVEPFWTNIPERYERYSWGKVFDESEKYTNLFIDYCQMNNLPATFFIVGKWAEMHSDVVKRISRCDLFQIGSHSYWHEDVAKLSDRDFLDDAIASKSILEDLTGQKVIRYRAPSFSIQPHQFELLHQVGYRIDSSVTSAGRIYGGNINEGEVTEKLDYYPLNGANVFGKELTILGGGYLRLLPKMLLRSISHSEIGNMVYLHPHDLSENIIWYNELTFLQNVRKRIHIGNTFQKLGVLRENFEFENF